MIESIEELLIMLLAGQTSKPVASEAPSATMLPLLERGDGQWWNYRKFKNSSTSRKWRPI
jgi:hypothetical protein